MNIAIEKTKEYIKKQVKIDRVSLINEPFSKYQKVYLSTNENIKEYLDLVSFKNKTNALTVLASGDHAFNLITKGILNIDTFDTNILTTYYVFGLKYAMILKYSYKEYLNILSILTNKQTNLELITTIIKDLLPYMDLKYRNYWNEIIDYNYNIQKDKSNHINIIYLLFMNIYSIDKIMMLLI